MKIEPKNDGRGRMQYDLPDGTRQLFISKEEVMKFFDLTERMPAGYGMASTVLFTELVQAAVKDDEMEGFDLSAGLAGPAISAWIRSLARNFLDAARNPGILTTDEFFHDFRTHRSAWLKVFDDRLKEIQSTTSEDNAEYTYLLHERAALVRCLDMFADLPPAPRKTCMPPVMGAGYGEGSQSSGPVDYEALARQVYNSPRPGQALMDAIFSRTSEAEPTIEADVEIVDPEALTDELLDSIAGQLWLGYTARTNQYQSAYGKMHAAAGIDCMRRAMEAQS